MASGETHYTSSTLVNGNSNEICHNGKSNDVGPCHTSDSASPGQENQTSYEPLLFIKENGVRVKDIVENKRNIESSHEVKKEINSECLDTLLQKLNINSYNPCVLNLRDFYKYALVFYRDKFGKAVHLSYEDNCYLVALTQQIANGPFNPATAKTLGVLDVVGRDRRIAWQSLGDISKEEAMKQFIERLNSLTSTFNPYIEAVIADHIDRENKKKEEEERKKEEEKLKLEEEEERRREEEERRQQEETKRQIQEALNQQTFAQFKLYAEQQFPGNPEQQAVLIRQLQEQHYQQYMQQVYQQQLLQQQRADPTQASEGNLEYLGSMEEENQSQDLSPLLQNEEKCAEEDVHIDDEGNVMSVAPASVWTRKDIKDFKNSIRLEGGDSIIKIGHGETVTVRVPTHQDGACLFWEFATDSYDIGFGIFFEWRKDAPSTGVTVHVTDSDDDDDDEEDDDEEEEEEEDGVASHEADDIERIAGVRTSDVNRKTGKEAGGSGAPRYPQSVIIPVYRRDSHEEVYAGSHAYPGTGVYLLKFDNSYSLWRNKVLYYRVYYTQR